MLGSDVARGATCSFRTCVSSVGTNATGGSVGQIIAVIRPTQTRNLDIVPATLELSAAEVELFNAIGREMALRDKLTPDITQRYEFIIIDCPPTLGLLTLNA